MCNTCWQSLCCCKTAPTKLCWANYIQWENITLTSAPSVWGCQSFTISAKWYIVRSPNNTITVVPKTEWNNTVFEIEKACCPDVLVALKPWCTWWYLDSVLKWCSSNINDGLITREDKTSDWICYREYCINLPQNKQCDQVLTDITLPNIFLKQPFVPSNGTSWCWTLTYILNDKCLLHEDISMDNEFLITLEDDKVWYITIPDTAYSRSIFATPTSICPSSLDVVTATVLADLYPWDEWLVWNNATPWVKNRFWTTKAVKTLNDGKYIINSGTTISHWQWIATIRSFVAVILPSWVNYLLWEQVYEWPRFKDIDNDDVINSSNDLINYVDWIDNPSDGSEMQGSITRSLPRVSYNMSRVVYLPANSLIYKVRKYSTNTAEDVSRDVLTLLFKRSWTAGTLSDESGGWNYLSVAEIPFKKLWI